MIKGVLHPKVHKGNSEQACGRDLCWIIGFAFPKPQLKLLLFGDVRNLKTTFFRLISKYVSENLIQPWKIGERKKEAISPRQFRWPSGLCPHEYWEQFESIIHCLVNSFMDVGGCERSEQMFPDFWTVVVVVSAL